MISEVAYDLDVELQSRGCPYRITYGPEPKPTTAFVRNRIVIERVRERGADRSAGPRSQQKNPNIVNARSIGVRVRIYAQSTLAGAKVSDHERLADAIADAFEAVLYVVGKKRRTEFTLPDWGLLAQDDLALEGLETWPGVVYEGRFSIDRGVRLAETWTAPSLPTKAFGPGVDDIRIVSTTKAQVDGDPAAPETACGG